MKNNRDKKLFYLILGYIAIFIAFCLLLGFFAGCAALSPRTQRIEKIESATAKLPPAPKMELLLYIWNEIDEEAEIIIQRENGEKKFILEGQTQTLLPLTKGGEYYFFVKTESLGIKGIMEGSFAVLPGQIKAHRGRLAGFHLVINYKNIRWNGKRMRNEKKFGNDMYSGNIKYERRQDKITIKTPVGNARAALSGGPAVLLRILTNKEND